MKGLGKEHICIIHGYQQQCGDGRGKGEWGLGGGGGQRGGGKTSSIMSIIKIKKKENDINK